MPNTYEDPQILQQKALAQALMSRGMNPQSVNGHYRRTNQAADLVSALVGNVGMWKANQRQQADDEAYRKTIADALSGPQNEQQPGFVGPPQDENDYLIRTLAGNKRTAPMALDVALRQKMGGSDVPTEIRAWREITKDLSPDDLERARRIKLGLDARPSGAWLNLGPGYLNPATGGYVERGLPPEKLPENVGAAAEASARGQVAGKGEIPESEKKLSAQKNVTAALLEASGLYDRLDELGSAVNVERGGMQNVRARFGASAVGQGIGGALGTEAQSVRNQINQLRPTLMGYIRQASNMGAKGLDSEKELEFYLQAVSDPSRDIQSNKAALKVLNDAYGLGADVKADGVAIAKLRDEFARASGGVATPSADDPLGLR